MKAFATELAVRFPDAKLRVENDVLHAIVRHGDSWFSTRSRSGPFAEIFVALRPTDGFQCAIRWGDRIRDPDVGDPRFDNAFGLATNDVALMRRWLDAPARAALLDSAYEYAQASFASEYIYEILDGFASEMSATTPTSRRTWTYELRGDELVASKGTGERDPARFAVAIETACALAARPYRWAQEYAAVARAIDGVACSVVDIGGSPVITTTRRATSITVRVVRRAAGLEELHTWISCPRLGLGGDALSLVRGDVRRTPELPPGRRASSTVPGYALRTSTKPTRTIDEATSTLLAVARPAAFVVHDTRVDVWLDGAPMEREVIDAGIELAALDRPARGEAHGPYR